jgi:hypothetical protein
MAHKAQLIHGKLRAKITVAPHRRSIRPKNRHCSRCPKDISWSQSGTDVDAICGRGDADMLEYWRKGDPPFNYGDYISELLLDVFGPIERDVILKDVTTTFHLIGSTISDVWIEKATKSASRPVFWGCGCRGSPIRIDRSAYVVHGVRGWDSHWLLGGSVPVIGDSGLLLPLLISKEQQVFGDTPIFVPHFLDSAADLRDESVRIISPRIVCLSELREVVLTIANASFVLAGSMHAAVTAIAYDVPFAFYRSGPQGFLDCPPKWTDLASVHGFEADFVCSIEEGQRWYNAIEATLRVPSLSRLLAHAPVPVRPEVLSKAATVDQIRYEDGRLQRGETSQRDRQ